jgi:hypothetical protein
MKKLYGLISLLIIVSLMGCNKEDEKTFSENLEEVTSESSFESDDNLFDYLEIGNISTSSDGTWYKVMGEIKNTYDKPIGGYIEVVAYDSNGKVVESRLIGLPIGGLQPNETFVFNESMTREPFSNVDFFDSALMIEE